LITAIHKSLAAKREMLAKDEKGFTLIELLVVVLIIGILTAIAVPVFIGQQDQAKDAAAKSDLGVAKVALISYYTANPTGTPTAALLADFGYQTSAGVGVVDLAAVTSSTVFCMDALSATGKTFSITQSSGVVEAAC
jgi:prepilin-type N-terminal cleavage/methylation domain-containing protein